MTFRLKKSPQETSPPTWPAKLMQSLAKYVFNSGIALSCFNPTHCISYELTYPILLIGNTFVIGDHVSWHSGLDGLKTSKIRHILLDKDPQLQRVDTAFGHVEFIQIVGITKSELKAAQKWNGLGILNILKRSPR